MICENCGAEIDAHEKSCPYCGHINPEGAEEAFMDRLEDLQEDLEDLNEQSRESDRKELGRQSVRLFRTGLILLLILAALIGSSMVTGRLWRRTADDEKTMIEFQRKYFGELDRLYEAGDDDAALDYMISLLDSREKGYEAVYDWKHYGYMQAFWNYRDGVQAAADLLKENWDQDTAQEAMLDAFLLMDQAEHADELPAEDREKVRELGQKGSGFLTEVIGMSRQEVKEMYESCLDEYGFFSWSGCRKACGKYLEEKS